MAEMAKFALNGASVDGDGTGLFGKEERHPQPEIALRWARLAAKSGDPEGQAVLATLLSGDDVGIRDLTAARRLFQQAASGNSPSGCLGLALLLARGLPSEIEQLEITRLIRRAAEGGLAVAIYLDGVVLSLGFGCRADPEAASLRYRAASEAGIRAAMTRLGLAYRVSGKPLDAETWLRRAAHLGDGRAATCLGGMLARPCDQPPNYLEAALWFERGAAAGDQGAARIVGVLHLLGLGRPIDLREADRWFRRATDLGRIDPLRDPADLISVLRKELRIFVDIEGWFLPGAMAGDDMSAYHLGVCLAIGLEGKEADLDKAAIWLCSAAATVPAARELLDDMTRVSHNNYARKAAA